MDPGYFLAIGFISGLLVGFMISHKTTSDLRNKNAHQNKHINELEIKLKKRWGE